MSGTDCQKKGKAIQHTTDIDTPQRYIPSDGSQILPTKIHPVKAATFVLRNVEPRTMAAGTQHRGAVVVMALGPGTG